MKKKIIAMITVMTLILTMAIPAMAGNGDNTGDDIFGWNVSIMNDYLLGNYTIGTEKVFRVQVWNGEGSITNVRREMKILGKDSVAKFQFKDDDKQWKDISKYNVVIGELKRNTVGREFKVTFNKTGVYSIECRIYDSADKVLFESKRKIEVTENEIKLTNLELVTTPETTKAPEVTTTPESTTKAPQTTKAPTVKVGKTSVKSASKSKKSTKAKISLKNIKGAKKYQVQISTTKNFKKTLVNKTVKKDKFTIKSKKIKNKKKLYVRARACTVVKGTTYCGKWSKAKRIKVK